MVDDSENSVTLLGVLILLFKLFSLLAASQL